MYLNSAYLHKIQYSYYIAYRSFNELTLITCTESSLTFPLIQAGFLLHYIPLGTPLERGIHLIITVYSYTGSHQSRQSVSYIGHHPPHLYRKQPIYLQLQYTMTSIDTACIIKIFFIKVGRRGRGEGRRSPAVPRTMDSSCYRL